MFPTHSADPVIENQSLSLGLGLHKCCILSMGKFTTYMVGQIRQNVHAKPINLLSLFLSTFFLYTCIYLSENTPHYLPGGALGNVWYGTNPYWGPVGGA